MSSLPHEFWKREPESFGAQCNFLGDSLGPFLDTRDGRGTAPTSFWERDSEILFNFLSNPLENLEEEAAATEEEGISQKTPKQNDISNVITERKQKGKRGGRKLVAIKQIPGLFLFKKVNYRKKPRSRRSNQINLIGEIKENEPELIPENVEEETLKSEITNSKRILETRRKISGGQPTKEWMDNERCQKNNSATQRNNRSNSTPSEDNLENRANEDSAEKSRKIRRELQKNLKSPVHFRKTGWPFAGRLCGGSPTPPAPSPPPPPPSTKNLQPKGIISPNMRSSPISNVASKDINSLKLKPSGDLLQQIRTGVKLKKVEEVPIKKQDDLQTALLKMRLPRSDETECADDDSSQWDCDPEEQPPKPEEESSTEISLVNQIKEPEVLDKVWDMEERNLVVIGSTGTGKSSICNVLAGRCHDDKDLFIASEKMESCTNKTTARKVDWRGNADLSFTLIDTPGLNDPEPGKDSLNIAEMSDELKRMKHVNVFLIVLNGANPRFDQSLIAMIRIFRNMFGKEFVENNTVFEFSHWPHDKKSVKRRGNNKNEVLWAAELNERLKELFGSKGNVPAVFIDCLYDNEDDQEVEKFEAEMKKLENHLLTFPPYACEGFEAVKTQLDQAEEDKKNLAAKAANAEKEKEESKTKLDQVEKEKKSLATMAEKEKEESKTKLDQVEKEKKNLAAKAANAEKEKEESKTKLDQVEKEKKSLATMAENAKKEKEESKTKLDQVEKEKKSLATMAENAKKEKEESKTKLDQLELKKAKEKMEQLILRHKQEMENQREHLSNKLDPEKVKEKMEQLEFKHEQEKIKIKKEAGSCVLQ